MTPKVLAASTQDRCIQSDTGRTFPFPCRRPTIPFLKVTTAKYRKKTAAYSKTAPAGLDPESTDPVFPRRIVDASVTQRDGVGRVQ